MEMEFDMDARYSTALSAIKVLQEESNVEVTKDDLNFISRTKLFMAADRARARRVIEVIMYGALDMLGIPRFPLPAEEAAAVIACYCSPANYKVCSYLLSGKHSFADDIIEGVDAPVVKPEVIYAMILQIYAGNTDLVDNHVAKLKARASNQSTTL